METIDKIYQKFEEGVLNFYSREGRKPTDCVMSCWMIDKLVASYPFELKSNEEFTFQGIKLHPCDSNFEMYFYRSTFKVNVLLSSCDDAFGIHSNKGE